MEHTASASKLSLSSRAIAICHGLRCVFNGAADAEERWLTLPAAGSDQFYFVRCDGLELRRGDDWLSSESI